MATNIATSLRIAIAALLTADAGAQALCERTSSIVVAWNGLADAQRPVYALQMTSNPFVGGDGDRREIGWQISAIAEGDSALTIAEGLAQRAREALTTTALLGQGIAVVDIGEPEERSETLDEPIPGYARIDQDWLFTVTAP